MPCRGSWTFLSHLIGCAPGGGALPPTLLFHLSLAAPPAVARHLQHFSFTSHWLLPRRWGARFTAATRPRSAISTTRSSARTTMPAPMPVTRCFSPPAGIPRTVRCGAGWLTPPARGSDSGRGRCAYLFSATRFRFDYRSTGRCGRAASRCKRTIRLQLPTTG